jgi:xanthine phosphoribosyltransferase
MPQFRDDVINHSVTWVEVHRDTKELARMLLEKGPWEGIIALTRGGLVPAAIIARELNIFVVDTLCVSTYDEQVREESNVLKTPERAVACGGKGWLLVDDLVDTGTTAKVARKILPHAHFATVYAKPMGRTCVDTCVHEVSQETWIYFPWDTEAQYVMPLAAGPRKAR